MTIPLSRYKQFLTWWLSPEAQEERKHLRFGQAFYNYMELHKMQQTPWLDCLYNARDDIALGMIREILDLNN
jgi:truncated hemoglobin YjbI